MTLSPALKKLLDDIKAYANKDEILAAIREEPDYLDVKNAIYQVAFNDGHQTATGQYQGAKTKLEEKLAAAKTAQQTAETALADLKKNNPDSAQLHIDYGKQIDELKAQVTTLTTQNLEEKKGGKKRELRNAVETELLGLRVEKHQAKVMADAYMENYSVGDDLAVRVLQPGKSIAYSGDEKAQVKALAADLFKEVPKQLILSKGTGGGSEADGDASGDTSDGTDKRSVLQRAAEAGRKKFVTSGTVGADGQNMDPQDLVQSRLGQRKRV